MTFKDFLLFSARRRRRHFACKPHDETGKRENGNADFWSLA